MTILIYYPC